MKIVVLDGYTLNPGDLSWERLKNIAITEIYDRTPPNLILERSQGADIIFTNKTPLNDVTFQQLPSLKYIGVLATGYNVVDVVAAKKHGIIVTNIPAYGTTSVAQMTFALLLELCNHVSQHSISAHAGEWSRSKDFCYWKQPLVELAGKTMGIIGYGRIGRKVGEIATAFGMKIIAAETRVKEPSNCEINAKQEIERVSLNELFKLSDIVTLHCPLFPDNAGLVNMERLKMMKPTAFLLNTARGGLIVEQDLCNALSQGIIAGAALDVLSTEPPSLPPLPQNPLIGAKNCIITPHISWATFEARSRLMDIAVKNLVAYLDGKPVNVV